MKIVIEYVKAGIVRIFVLDVVGRNDTHLWGVLRGELHVFEKQWITQIASVESGALIEWRALPYQRNSPSSH